MCELRLLHYERYRARAAMRGYARREGREDMRVNARALTAENLSPSPDQLLARGQPLLLDGGNHATALVLRSCCNRSRRE